MTSPMPDTVTPEQLDELERRHHRQPSDPRDGRGMADVCCECGQRWPCIAASLVRTIREQAATIEGLEDMVLAYRTTTDNNPDALVRDVEWPNDFEMIAEIAMRRALSEEAGK